MFGKGVLEFYMPLLSFELVIREHHSDAMEQSYRVRHASVLSVFSGQFFHGISASYRSLPELPGALMLQEVTGS